MMGKDPKNPQFKWVHNSPTSKKTQLWIRLRTQLGYGHRGRRRNRTLNRGGPGFGHRCTEGGIENWLIGLLQPVIDNLKKPDYVQRVEIKQFSLGDEPLSVRNGRAQNFSSGQ
ncbi:hypothetical protein CK203_015795 [Vitis vinifera]|uniref:Uncharacterized protein n=1 Tax=Vitis vinifera TaxID=29760 RepID=A0A438JRL9_VITVI|nr:hypothetical protein CK203_015795 [Vitis vinifera]